MEADRDSWVVTGKKIIEEDQLRVLRESSEADPVDMIQVEKKLTGKKINNHQTLPRPYAHATTHPPSPLPKKKNRFDKDPRAHSISKVAMRSNTSPLSERGVSAVRLLASARRHAERSYSCDDITPSPNHFAGSQRRYAGSTTASISKKETKKKKQRARHREDPDAMNATITKKTTLMKRTMSSNDISSGSSADLRRRTKQRVHSGRIQPKIKSRGSEKSKSLHSSVKRKNKEKGGPPISSENYTINLDEHDPNASVEKRATAHVAEPPKSSRNRVRSNSSEGSTTKASNSPMVLRRGDRVAIIERKEASAVSASGNHDGGSPLGFDSGFRLGTVLSFHPAVPSLQLSQQPKSDSNDTFNGDSSIIWSADDYNSMTIGNTLVEVEFKRGIFKLKPAQLRAVRESQEDLEDEDIDEVARERRNKCNNSSSSSNCSSGTSARTSSDIRRRLLRHSKHLLVFNDGNLKAYFRAAAEGAGTPNLSREHFLKLVRGLYQESEKEDNAYLTDETYDNLPLASELELNVMFELACDTLFDGSGEPEVGMFDFVRVIHRFQSGNDESLVSSFLSAINQMNRRADRSTSSSSLSAEDAIDSEKVQVETNLASPSDLTSLEPVTLMVTEVERLRSAFQAAIRSVQRIDKSKHLPAEKNAESIGIDRRSFRALIKMLAADAPLNDSSIQKSPNTPIFTAACLPGDDALDSLFHATRAGEDIKSSSSTTQKKNSRAILDEEGFLRCAAVIMAVAPAKNRGNKKTIDRGALRRTRIRSEKETTADSVDESESQSLNDDIDTSRRSERSHSEVPNSRRGNRDSQPKKKRSKSAERWRPKFRQWIQRDLKSAAKKGHKKKEKEDRRRIQQHQRLNKVNAKKETKCSVKILEHTKTDHDERVVERLPLDREPSSAKRKEGNVRVLTKKKKSKRKKKKSTSKSSKHSVLRVPEGMRGANRTIDLSPIGERTEDEVETDWEDEYPIPKGRGSSREFVHVPSSSGIIQGNNFDVTTSDDVSSQQDILSQPSSGSTTLDSPVFGGGVKSAYRK